MSITNFKSPDTIPTKNSYLITGSEQCFGYMNNTSVQMYDLSEILGSCITNNNGTKYNVLIIKYDGTNYTLLNEGVTSSSLITYLNDYGPVWAYLIDNSNNIFCEMSEITSDSINGDAVDFYFYDYILEFYGSTLSSIIQGA
jgi:hypothetical protein